MQSGNQGAKSISSGVKRPKLGCAFALLPIAAVILAIVGGWYFYSSWTFYSKGVEVQGTVVRLEGHSSSDSGYSYSPVFSYSVAGQQYEYESVNSSNPPSNEVGDVVTLLYNPDYPGKARQNNFWELWLLPLVLCPASIFMLALSIFIPMLMRVMPGN